MTPTPVAAAIMGQYGLIFPTQSGEISWRLYVLAGGKVAHIGKR